MISLLSISKEKHMDTQSGVMIYNYMDTFFCCHVNKDKLCEDRVNEHMLVYICSGELTLISKEKRYYLKKGDAFFLNRNHMLRKIKQPSSRGEPFKGLFLQLRMPFLKTMLAGNNITVPLVTIPAVSKAHYILLEKHPFLSGLFTSLEQYFGAQQYPSRDLMEVKLKEAVFALLQLKPELGTVLFDFAEPWKIDLADFINHNYKCDMSIEEFAHYTGRSLSTFKKDFYTIFQITPGRWLIKRRLEEAKALMDKEGRKPADIYLEVGFKNLSHFSTAFKKEYGLPPSALVNSTAM